MNNLMRLLLPGSRDSVAEGCTCPTDANDYGAGAYTLKGVPQFYIDDACPIHGTQRTYAGQRAAVENTIAPGQRRYCGA